MHSLKSAILTRPGYLRLGLLLLALTLIALLAMPMLLRAQSAVLVSNIGQQMHHEIDVTTIAQPFTTGGSENGYNLSAVNLNVTDDPSSDREHQVIVDIVTNTTSGGVDVPSHTDVHTLSRPSSIGTGTQVFAAPANAKLKANTKYWVVIRFLNTNVGDFQVQGTRSDAQDSGAASGWSIGNGAVRGTRHAATPILDNNVSIAIELAIVGSAVPLRNIATLKSLTLKDASTGNSVALSPSFTSSRAAYSAEVREAVSQVTIKGTAKDDAAKSVKYLDENGAELSDANRSKSGFQVDLEETGDTIVQARVTAQNGTTTGTYKVTIERADETAPVLESAAVNTAGTLLELNFDEKMASDASVSEFRDQVRVTADGEAVTIGLRSLEDLENWLLSQLSPPIHAGQKVVVTYTDPSSNDDSNAAFQDFPERNDSPSFTTGEGGVPKVVNNSEAGPPLLTGARVEFVGDEITLTFSKELGPVAGLLFFQTNVEVTVDGAAVTIGGREYDNDNDEVLTLTGLTPVISAGQKVVVQYTDPDPTSNDTGALEGADGQDVASFTTGEGRVPQVVNEALDTIPPALLSAEVNREGTEMTLVFNETNMRTGASLSRFREYVSVTAGGDSVTIGGRSRTGAGDTWVLSGLSPVIRGDDEVVVAYTDPADDSISPPFEDDHSNDTASFTTGEDGVAAVVNNSLIGIPPVPTVAATHTSFSPVVFLEFNKRLDQTSEPPTSTFTVEANGVGREVSDVAWNGNIAVRLEVTPALRPGETVRISYTPPTDPNENRLKDEAGNAVVAFTKGVQNKLFPTAPEAPQNLRAVPGNRSMIVHWDAPWPNGSPITNYRVRHKKGSGAWEGQRTVPGGGNAINASFSLLDNGDEYTFQVSAQNAEGWGDWAEIMETPGGPRITGITVSDPGDAGFFATGDTITVSVTFTQNVTLTGALTLELVVGTQTFTLTNPSGSGTDTLAFTYPVLAADEDTDGVSVPANALTLDSRATLRGSGNLDADLTHAAKTFPDRKVNPPVPEITGIEITSDPNDDSRDGDDHTYAIGDTVEVTVTFGQAVTVSGTPELALDFGGTPTGAEYDSGSGSTALVFEVTVAGNDAAPDGIAIGADSLTLEGGTIKSSADTDISASLDHGALSADPGHRVDGVRPTLVSAETSTDGTKVILTFNEAIASVVTAGFSVLHENSPINGPGAAVVDGRVEVPLTFRRVLHGYVVVVKIAAGKVEDLAGNSNLQGNPFNQTVTNTVPQPPAAVSGVAISSTPDVGTSYATGERVEITVTFDTAVDVTGAPRIRIGLLDANNAYRRWADYDRGSGGTELVFVYDVPAADESDTNGILVLRGSLELNGGTIRKAGTTDDAQLAHDGVGNDDSQRVNWVRPVFESAGTSVDGSGVVVRFSEALDTATSGTSILTTPSLP